MNSEVVSVSSVSKRFGNIIALDEFSLSINHGIFGLIGPNGAGKTTLLRILIGLIRADHGEAAVLGFDPSRDSLEIRRLVGVLHETPVYPQSLSVRRFLDRIADLYPDGRSVEEVLDLVDLSDSEKRKIGKLSAGMRQKLGVAQALVGSPRLVILDEPTSNLDVMTRRDLLATISRVHEEEGVAFCIISHVLSELERICTNVAFINKGRVIVSGPIHDIVAEFSTNQYQVLLSDPKAVFSAISALDGVDDAEITSTKTITLVTRDSARQELFDGIRRIAERSQVQLHEIERTRSLERAFLEVMRREEKR